MTIHKEGYKSILISAILFAIINLASFYFISFNYAWLSWAIFIVTLVLLLFIISFFRIPRRKLMLGSNMIIAPADGKVVVIEEVYDEEYFKDKRLQISIFMSPANVHQNRTPVTGEVVYSRERTAFRGNTPSQG
jgi:phosphatidylserine decarboxylase